MKLITLWFLLQITIYGQALDSLIIKSIDLNGSAVQGIEQGFSKLLIESSIENLDFDVQFAAKQSPHFYVLNTPNGYELILNIEKLKRENGYSSVILQLKHKHYFQKMLELPFLPGRRYHLAVSAPKEKKGVLKVSEKNKSKEIFIDGKPLHSFHLEGSKDLYSIPTGKRKLEVREKGFKTHTEMISIQNETMRSLGEIKLEKVFFKGYTLELAFTGFVMPHYTSTISGLNLGIKKHLWEDVAYHINLSYLKGQTIKAGFNDGSYINSEKFIDVDRHLLLSSEMSYWVFNNNFIGFSFNLGGGLGHKSYTITEEKLYSNEGAVDHKTINQASTNTYSYMTVGYGIELIRYWDWSIGADIRGVLSNLSKHYKITNVFRVRFNYKLSNVKAD